MGTRLGRYLLLHLIATVMVSVTACRAQPEDVYTPPPGVDVVHYELDLRLLPEEMYLYGHARLHVRSSKTLLELPLALTGLDVDSVLVDGDRVEVTLEDERLYVPLPDGGGERHIDIAYRGGPVEGLYAEAHDGQMVIYTDSWPDRVKGWMPGVHHSSDPATLDLAVQVPAGYEAVATGTTVGIDSLDGAVRYRWQLDAVAPTYSFAFAVSDFAVTLDAVDDTLPVAYYLLPSDSADVQVLRRTPEMLAYFADLLGPYPFDQYATVQVPFAWGGMENASASFLNADRIHAGQGEATQAHEVAHQWFGTHVVIANWRDLWLSEGFATYLTTLFYEHADGLDEARRRWVEMADLTPQRAETLTELVPREPVDPDEYFSWVPYERGGSVLHLLRRMLGDDVFFRAIKRTAAAYAGRPLSTDAFQALLEAESGRALTAVFDVWVYGEALPVLETRWEAEARRLSWAVTGDAGTLDGVPVLLQVRQNEQVHYVPLADGAVMLDADAEPEVKPVGVMLRVE